VGAVEPYGVVALAELLNESVGAAVVVAIAPWHRLSQTLLKLLPQIS